MALSPISNHAGATRFTNYSSIHSADAFVGDYQVRQACWDIYLTKINANAR